MTWQRIINRNGLADGSYTTPPARWVIGVNTNVMLQEDASKLTVFPHLVSRLTQYETQSKMFAGDLARLVDDSLDEKSICKWISDRTNVPPDAVAHVLKEFFNL
jgi:hypothetical protein